LKAVLFVGIDGVIVLPGGIAPYAKPFLHWASSRFDVRWLTAHPPAKVFRLAENLGLRGDAVSYAGFRHSRLEAFGNVAEFCWVDVLLPAVDLTQFQLLGRGLFVAVDPRVGVMPAQKAALENVLGR
jgi:hypothetical protein